MDVHKKSIKDIPKILDTYQLDGFEISDRELIYLSDEDRVLLIQKSEQNKLEVVTDINLDIASQNTDRIRQQIAHALDQIKMAKQMNAKRIRIGLGGQTISLQKLWGLTHRLKRTPDSHFSNSRAKNKILFSSKNWIGYLAHNIRKNTKAQVWRKEEKIKSAIEALKMILPTSEKMKIRLAIENHWGISSRPEWIMGIVDSVNSSFLGTCPDFGNWPKDISPTDGITILASKAVVAHIKSVNPRQNVSKQFV